MPTPPKSKHASKQEPSASTRASAPQGESTRKHHSFFTYYIGPDDPVGFHSPVAAEKSGTAKPQLKLGPVSPHTCEVLTPEGGGRVFRFHFGAVTFWNIDQDKIPALLDTICLGTIRKRPDIWDDYRVEVAEDAKPKVHFASMTLDAMTADRAEVIALTLAQSSVMVHYENSCQAIWQTLDETIKSLRLTGKVSMRASHLPKTIGKALEIRSQVVRVLHMLDRSDLLWEDRVMDQLYDDLRASFDLPERYQALEHKLGHIQDSSQLLLDIAGDRRFVWLESAIVIMIAFDIIMTLIEKYG